LDEFEVAIALANNTTIGLCDRCADDQAYLDDAGLERGANALYRGLMENHGDDTS
jgi:hypothetical protein